MELMNYYYNEFDKLLKKYKPLAERYNYYRFLLAVQQHYSAPYWNDSDAAHNCYYIYDDLGYNKSTVVVNDFTNGNMSDPFHHKEGCTGGPGGAHYVVNLGNEHVRYYKTGYINTNHSKGWSNNGQTLGKNRIDWQYKCASSRRLEVIFEYKGVKMPPDKYPFVGL